MTTSLLQPGDALVVVDVQNDFLPGGALAVSHGEDVIPVLNSYIEHFTRRRLPIFFTRDWHPENHCSFREQSGPWPSHCVVHSPGAEFAATLNVPALAQTFSKGIDPQREAYSDFEHPEFEARLRTTGVRRLFVGGLATDYCILHTVRDALQRGFRVHLLTDAIRAVNVAADDGRKAEAEMLRLGAVPVTLESLKAVNPGTSALLTDYYQLTMLRGYQGALMDKTAVFEFFVRALPPGWNFLVAAGLEQVLDYLEDFRFSEADLEWLEMTGGFESDDIARFRALRFTGDVHAMPEGTIFFPDEPILRVTAPIAEGQIIETRLVNLLHFQTLIASKAVRSVVAAPDKILVDFGARRAHGAEASLLAARACVVAGFRSTSNVLAAAKFGIPFSGTMAHSWIEACESEEEAFLRFARANPERVILLLDTYDTEVAAHKVVALAPVLRAEGITIKGVRLDSGDLGEHARRVRRILDDAGLEAVTIFASGNIDEHALKRLVVSRAPIDGFGMGSRIVTSADAPYLDCAYKIQEYGGRPRCKHSEGKATWPGAKQVYRHFNRDGGMAFDVVASETETRLGLPLLQRVMHRGERTSDPVPLAEIAQRLKFQLATLSGPLLALSQGEWYSVIMSQALQTLAQEMGLIPTDTRTGAHAAAARPHPSSLHASGLLSRIYTDSGPPPNEPGEVDENTLV